MFLMKLPKKSVLLSCITTYTPMPRRIKSKYTGEYTKRIFTRCSMCKQEVWKTIWSLGGLDMYKEVRTGSTQEVTNVFCFVSFNEPLELWFHQTRSKKYDNQQKCLFLPHWKTKWPWMEYDDAHFYYLTYALLVSGKPSTPIPGK